MRNLLGCLGAIILITVIIAIVQWMFTNILGLIGILAMIAGASLLTVRKEQNIDQYWIWFTIVTGFFLTLSWFTFKEYLNALGFLSSIVFFYFSGTSIYYFIKKNNAWKGFSGLTAAFFVSTIVLISISPELEVEQATSIENNIMSPEKEDEKDENTEVKTTTKDVKKESDEPQEDRNIDNNDETITPIIPAAPVTNNVSNNDNNATSAPTPQDNKSTDTSGTTDKIPVTLVRVVDGDTIKVIYDGKEQNVRYLLVDTPETDHPRLGKQPFGQEAKERNVELLNSGEVSIEFDVGERIDKYGRLLAYIYVDGKSVQEALLEEGLARVAYVYPPNTRYLDEFKAAEQIAKDKKIGIWSIENYATDSGLNSSTNNSNKKNPSNSNTIDESTSNVDQDTNGDPSSGYYVIPSAPTNFKNCDEMRKYYPNGVHKSHPAYAPARDRDKDGWACER